MSVFGGQVMAVTFEKSILTRQQRIQIAEQLARDNLPTVDMLQEIPTVRESFYTKYAKRWIDVLVSLLALIITIPVNLVIAVITLFDVGRPILFKQQRVGKDEHMFTIVKFRNMRNTTDERGELLPPSRRVTKFGKFVRKTSLDELLNFWCILKGDMSIIGPRPLEDIYIPRYSRRHRFRLKVRPGLECPPRNRVKNGWTWSDQFENDIWYVENVSFLTDCKMLWYLIRFAFDRKSANARAVRGRGIFMGYDLQGNAINLEDIPEDYIDRTLNTYKEESALE